MNWKLTIVLLGVSAAAPAQDYQMVLQNRELKDASNQLSPHPQRHVEGVQAQLSRADSKLAFLAFAPAGQSFAENGDTRESDRNYRRGIKALDANKFSDAIQEFDGEIAGKGARADGAYYWKAYAQNRLGRRAEALATIAELRKQFPNSRWMDDAKALEVEVRAQEGQPVSPNSESNEDLKLIALNALMQSDPNRAVPILRNLLNSGQSPKVKEHALFVLSQSDSREARQIVADLARSGNPDMQRPAIHYLSMMGDEWSRGQLAAIYRASSDPRAKREVLNGYLIAGAKDKLLELAKGEKDPELRKQAINILAQTGAKDEIWNLYKSEQNPEVKREIVHSMLMEGDSGHLLEIAKSERDLQTRKEALTTLALTGWGKENGEMAKLYQSETNNALKKELINGMFLQGDAKGLVALARQEKDPELKRDIVSHLALMGSKDSTDYMMEILK